MRHPLFLAFAASALVAQAFGLRAEAQELPDPLRIATEGAYAPFNYLDENGKPQGFEVDLADALCKNLNANCEIVVQEWDGIIPGLLAGKYDAVMASLYITDERRERIAFSDKYYKVPARFVVPSSSKMDITPEGMEGVAVGTQRATSFERFMRDEFPGIDLRVYATIEEAYLDLAAGRVDAIMGDVVAVTQGFLDKPEGKGFEFRGPDYTGEKWFGYGAGVGVRKDQQYIADAFSAAIRQIREDGTYQTISQKWFGRDVFGD
jgi:lysine-arginine-ornithine-binding protein